MKPKKRNDHRACSDLRSKTLLCVVHENELGQRSPLWKGHQCGRPRLSEVSVLDCHSAQYPVPARVSPATAAASNVADIHRSCLNHLATASAPLLSLESDNPVLPASILTQGI